MDMDIATISPGGRAGRSLGDMGSLKACITAEGLKHPVTVSPSRRLILGARRLEACHQLGWRRIGAEIAESVPQALDRMRADAEDACCVHPMTVAEAMSIDFAMRDELDWWPRDGTSKNPATGRHDGHRNMLASAHGLNERQYSVARELALAAQGYRYVHGTRYGIPRENREQAARALAAVKSPADLNAALRIYRTGHEHQPSAPLRDRKLPSRSQVESVNSALAALGGITSGLAGAIPVDPATPADVIQRWGHDTTQAIRILSKLRRELRNHGYRDSDNDRD